MSEDRTAAPSRMRRDAARAQGLAAHSPLLVVSLGLIVVVALLGWFGGAVVQSSVGFIRNSIRASAQMADNPSLAIAGELRDYVASVAPVVALIGGAALVVIVMAHLLQTGGLFAPGRLAPSPGRLWQGTGHSGTGGRVVGVATSSFFALCLLAVLAGVLLWQSDSLARLPMRPFPEFLQAASGLIGTALVSIAIVGILSGLVELIRRRAEFERMLQTTPDEQRAEQKAIDGDPAVRSRRMELARRWQRDPGEILAGAALVLTGDAGLTVLLAGSPPPGPVSVRTIARGVAASSLRHAAEQAGLPVVKDATLTAWFSTAGRQGGRLPAAMADRVRACWPGAQSDARTRDSKPLSSGSRF